MNKAGPRRDPNHPSHHRRATDSPAFKAVAQVLREDKKLQAKQALPDVPEAVLSELDKLPETEVLGKPLLELLQRALKNAQLPEEERNRVAERLAGTRSAARADEIGIGDIAPGLDLTMDVVPGLEGEVARAHVAAVTHLAGLPDEIAERVLKGAPALGLLNEQRIGTLVVEGVLKEDQAHRLGTIGSLALLLGGDTQAAGRVVESFYAMGLHDLVMCAGAHPTWNGELLRLAVRWPKRETLACGERLLTLARRCWR